MAEWTNATVLKTVICASVSWVRIPLPPPYYIKPFQCDPTYPIVYRKIVQLSGYYSSLASVANKILQVLPYTKPTAR